MELHELSLVDMESKLKAGEITSPELVKHFLSRVKKYDEKIHSILYVNKEGGDAALETEGSFAGIPYAVKDVFNTKGIPTTAGSKILEGYKPPFNATAVERLAGGVLLGKNNMDEFAMGVSTEFSAYGPTKNPWNTEHVPGGSSGGSAAAVATRLAPVALGTDTGGSIRQPASFCGVVGFKPSYGSIPRYGVVSMCSSLDTVGVFANSVEDAAYVYDLLVGPDGFDATVVDAPKEPSLPQLKGASMKGVRVGVPKEYFEGKGIDKEVRESVESAIKEMEKAGATLIDISLPHTELAVPVYYIIVPSEVSSNLARYDGIRYGVPAEGAKSITETYEQARTAGFGPEAKRRIMIGAYTLSAGYFDAFYVQATKVRSLIAKDFEEAFKEVDVIATPTTPTTAFKFGSKKDLISLYKADIFTAPASLAGVPAISVPTELDKKGLPIGLQLIGPRYKDRELLGVAHAYQQLKPFKEVPSI